MLKFTSKLMLICAFVFSAVSACPSGEGSENDCPGGCCIESD